MAVDCTFNSEEAKSWLNAVLAEVGWHAPAGGFSWAGMPRSKKFGLIVAVIGGLVAIIGAIVASSLADA